MRGIHPPVTGKLRSQASNSECISMSLSHHGTISLSSIGYTKVFSEWSNNSIPQLVVHVVYHQEHCSQCGQLNVKYNGKTDISVDKISLFELFFLGFFSDCLPNIYLNILEYFSTLDFFHLIKVIYKHFAIQRYTAFQAHALVVEWGDMPLWAFLLLGTREWL